MLEEKNIRSIFDLVQITTCVAARSIPFHQGARGAFGAINFTLSFFYFFCGFAGLPMYKVRPKKKTKTNN